MKRKDLHIMNNSEMIDSLKELNMELMKENVQRKLKTASQNSKRIRSIRRNIAQLKTKLGEVVKR